MKAKQILALLTALVLALGLGACASGTNDSGAGTPSGEAPAPASQGGSETPTPSGDVEELVFWYCYTDLIQQCNEDLTRMFNESVGAEKGIKVTAEYQGTYTDCHQKLQTSYVANTMPNLTVIEVGSPRRFAEAGVIDSVQPFIDRDNFDMSDFYDGLLENAFANGEYVGLPYLRSTPLLYFNMDMLREAGLDPSGPKNLDELASYCKTIYEELGAYGLTITSDSWLYECFMLGNGITPLNEDMTATNIASQESVYILNFFRELIDAGYVRTLAFADETKTSADVANRVSAMWFHSCADLSRYIEIGDEAGFEVGTGFYPTNGVDKVASGGCVIAMTSQQSDSAKDASWEFMKYVTDTTQTVYASSVTGYIPVRKSSEGTQELADLYAQMPQFETAIQQLPISVGRPMHKNYGRVQIEGVIPLLDAVWVNQMDVESTVAEYEAIINNVLNE